MPCLTLPAPEASAPRRPKARLRCRFGCISPHPRRRVRRARWRPRRKPKTMCPILRPAPAWSQRHSAGVSSTRCSSDCRMLRLKLVMPLRIAGWQEPGRSQMRHSVPISSATSSPLSTMLLTPHCSRTTHWPRRPLPRWSGGQVIAGTVDRLLVTEHFVHVVDFKTGRAVPPDASRRTGVRICARWRPIPLRLRAIFPDREIRASLLYSAGAPAHRPSRYAARAAQAGLRSRAGEVVSRDLEGRSGVH